MLELSLATTLLLVLTYVRFRKVMRGRRQETHVANVAALCRDAVGPVSVPATLGMLDAKVVRVKGLSTGRMFKASVRLTVTSDRNGHVEQHATPVRESKYSPAGFAVEFFHDFSGVPVFAEDCMLSIELVEHVPAKGGVSVDPLRAAAFVVGLDVGAPTALATPATVAHEMVLASIPVQSCNDLLDPSDGWHALVPALGYDEQTMGGMIKLKFARRRPGDLVGISLGQLVFGSESSAAELTDALMHSAHRVKAIKSCLEHVQKLVMTATKAGVPMKERKAVYVLATIQLRELSVQPLCVSPYWSSDGGSAATAAVGALMWQVLQAPIDTEEAVAVKRSARFVETVHEGPEYSKMYEMLASREEVPRQPGPQPGPQPEPEPHPAVEVVANPLCGVTHVASADDV